MWVILLIQVMKMKAVLEVLYAELWSEKELRRNGFSSCIVAGCKAWWLHQLSLFQSIGPQSTTCDDSPAFEQALSVEGSPGVSSTKFSLWSMKVFFLFGFFCFVSCFYQGYHGPPMLHICVSVLWKTGWGITSLLLTCIALGDCSTAVDPHHHKQPRWKAIKPTILAREEYIIMLFLNMSHKAAEKSSDCLMVSACGLICVMDAATERNQVLLQMWPLLFKS